MRWGEVGRRLHSFLSLCPAVGSAHVCCRYAMRELDESARKLSCLVVYELIQLALVFCICGLSRRARRLLIFRVLSQRLACKAKPHPR